MHHSVIEQIVLKRVIFRSPCPSKRTITFNDTHESSFLATRGSTILRAQSFTIIKVWQQNLHVKVFFLPNKLKMNSVLATHSLTALAPIPKGIECYFLLHCALSRYSVFLSRFFAFENGGEETWGCGADRDQRVAGLFSLVQSFVIDWRRSIGRLPLQSHSSLSDKVGFEIWSRKWRFANQQWWKFI